MSREKTVGNSFACLECDEGTLFTVREVSLVWCISVKHGIQDTGTLFVGPGEKVYSGMVIGQNGKAEDIELNVCKTKHLTNTRSSSADDALKLVPPKILSLEQAIEFIDQDELLEVTPTSLRIRKRILDSRDRKRAAFRKS